MLRSFCLGCIGSVVLMATPAVMAQERQEPKHIIFDDQLIEGARLIPPGSTIQAQHDDELGSLIKSRDSFLDEMLEQVEDL